MTSGTTAPVEEEMSPDSIDGGSEGQLLEIALGPHHPSTHGVFRMDVVLDGERVVKLKPVFGYLHRNHEKIAETASYLSSMPYTDRLDYMCSLTNNWAYALAVEKLWRPGKLALRNGALLLPGQPVADCAVVPVRARPGRIGVFRGWNR